MMWADFGWQGWLTLGTLVGVLILLISDRVSADVACLGGLALLLIAGVVDLEVGLSGFANEGVLTVAVLYVVAAGLFISGGLRLITGQLFSAVRGLRRGMVRLMIPTAMASGVLNNTPIVAMLLPGTIQWARENNIDPARLLIPLSYASILGGTCTLIGTSTNLVVDGLLRSSGHPGFGFFAIAWVGIPTAIVGMLFLVIVGPYLLPKRSEEPAVFRAPDRYTTEVMVPPNSPHIGQPIGQIALGKIDGLAPVAIARQGVLIPAPALDTRLVEGDHLIFSEPAAAVLKLHRFPDFSPAPRGLLIPPRIVEKSGRLVEVVLSQNCPLVGSVVGDGSFRRDYGAAVVAIARQGERIVPNRMEDWRLKAGDVLLLEAGESFDVSRLGRDAFVIDEHREIDTKFNLRSLISVLFVIAMVGAAFLEVLSIFQAATAAAALMLLFKVITPAEARDSLDWTVLLTIAAAFGIAGAMEQTGVAASIAATVVTFGAGPWITLALFYLATSLLTESITNNAAAALMFPFALTIAASLGVSPIPFAVAIMFAASASFATPLGYQTNLMVYGAGNYRFRDFLKIGLPMNILVGSTAVLLIPFFFPF